MSKSPSGPVTVSEEVQQGVAALDSRACPDCGGKAEWSPRQRKLVCPYCGRELNLDDAADDEPGVIEERELRQALEQAEAASANAATGQRKVVCQQCNAQSLMPAKQVAERCEFCGSPQIVAYDEIESTIRPESLLPKQIDKSRAHGILKTWSGGRFWAPRDLKRRNLVENVKGVYLPYWTFDAAARCPWEAESGTYYWDSVWTTDAKGRRVRKRVRKIRWRPASGEVGFRFDDVLVPATRLLEPARLKQIEPFPTKELVPYDTDYIAGWAAELYQVTLRQGAELARSVMQAFLRNLAGKDVPGDTYRNLRIHPRYSDETFKHILVPVWLLVYQYRGKLYKTAINGYTGKISGEYPKSGWKIFFAVSALLLVVGIVVLLASQR